MPIGVVEYDAGWPARADQAVEELAASVPGLFLVVEHVGSTAVPGLAAKPVIDLMASVPDLGAVTGRDAALEGLGYLREETGMRGRLFYVRTDAEHRRTHHLHVVTADTWDTRNERLLRDHLLRHPDAAAEYAALKIRLGATAEDGLDYTRGKTELIQTFVDRERVARKLPLVPVWED